MAGPPAFKEISAFLAAHFEGQPADSDKPDEACAPQRGQSIDKAELATLAR